ncbi:MAG: metallophosphoesterase [Clostridia bacterium]|nr:metallophosphoesterase [Clostridia bacterium]
MAIRKIFIENDKYQEQIKELFKELTTPEVYENWGDTFDIECLDGKNVVIMYHGEEKIKKFKKECKKTLVSCVISVMGGGKKVKFSKKKGYNALSPKTKKNIRTVKFFALGMIFVCIAAAVIIILFNYIGNRNFRETFYSTSSLKVDSRIRIIQLSDLHSTSYGKNNSKLLKRVEELKPDIIICTGDLVDYKSGDTTGYTSEDIEYAVNFGEGLAKIAPSYYVYGNNEVEAIYQFPLNEDILDSKLGFKEGTRDENTLREMEDVFEDRVEETGLKILKNEKDTIKVKNMTVDIYGVLTSNPSSFWSYSGQSFNSYIEENPDNIKITAVHEPFIFEEFQSEFWGDLMLCGHTHGGVVRVPVLGPLYTHEGILFPEKRGYFAYGRHDVAGKPLIVSGGMENKIILRVNNQPELVVVDINKF